MIPRQSSATERAEHAVALKRVKEVAVSEVEALDVRATARRSATVVVRLIQLTGASLILAACTASTTPTASASAAVPTSCGEVSNLVPNADFGGYGLARAGPVWFSAFGRVVTGKAVLADFAPGHPTKVVIHPDAGPHPEVQVRGIECASGRTLHFCYNQGDCGFTSQPVPESELERRGDAVVTIAENQHTDDTGYMLFARPGKYMVWVRQGTLLLGSVVFQVG